MCAVTRGWSPEAGARWVKVGRVLSVSVPCVHHTPEGEELPGGSAGYGPGIVTAEAWVRSLAREILRATGMAKNKRRRKGTINRNTPISQEAGGKRDKACWDPHTETRALGRIRAGSSGVGHLLRPPRLPAGQFPFDLLHMEAELKVGDTASSHGRRAQRTPGTCHPARRPFCRAHQAWAAEAPHCLTPGPWGSACAPRRPLGVGRP